MLTCVCWTVLVGVAASTSPSLSPLNAPDDAAAAAGGGGGGAGVDGSCQLTLPVGCSCLQDRTAVSVECSAAQMTSVPKHWFASGNLVVKTLNLERNNISEVHD